MASMITVGSAIAYLHLDTSRYTNSLQSARRQMETFRDSSADSTARMASLGQGMQTMGKSLTMGLTVPLVATGTLASKTAIELESAFSGIRKTVDATEEEFSTMRKEIDDLATNTLPVAISELYGIGEAAGQLGIEKENIVGFTDTIAKVGVATNLTSEQAATSFARLGNIMGTSQQDFDRMGSSIIALGNNFATIESEITDMSLRLAGTGSQIGLTEAQVLAFATAMSSVGINAEAGGSAMSRVWQKMNSDVLSGGKNLKMFAQVTGVSATEFANTWKSEPSEAVTQFVAGLGRIKDSGGDVTSTLKAMGISSIQEVDTLLRLSGASDVLTESLELGTKAWEENTALQDEANEKFKTTESQLQLLKNNFTKLADGIGQALLPMINALIQFLIPLIQSFNNMSKGTKTVIVILGAFAAIIPPIILLIGSMLIFTTQMSTAWGAMGGAAGIATMATGAWATVTSAATLIAGAFGTAIKALLGPIGWVILGISALVTGITYLYKKYKKTTKDIKDDNKNTINDVEGMNEKIQTVVKGLDQNLSAKGFKGLGEDINSNLADGIEGSSGKPIGAMSKVGEDMKKAMEKKAKELRESLDKNVSELDKFGDAIVTALKNKYSKMQTDQISHIDKRLNEEQKASDGNIKIIEKTADQERNSLNNRLDELRKSTDNRIKEYEREYNEQLKYLDVDTQKKVGSIQGQIDNIDKITQAEDKALAEREHRERLSDLERQKAKAETSEERAKIQLDIDRLVEDRRRKLLLEGRQADKEALRQRIEDVKKAADERKEQLKQELEEKKQVEKEKLDVQIESINAELEQLKVSTQAKIDLEKERVKQISEGLNLEKTAIQTHYSSLMEQENLMQEARKMAISKNNNEIISLLATYNPKWQDAGQSFADAMVSGLNSENETMQQAISRSLNLEPVITAQKVELESLEKQLELLREQDGDLFPQTTQGLENTSDKANKLADDAKAVDKALKDTDKKVEESKSIWKGFKGVLSNIWSDMKTEFAEVSNHNETVLNSMFETLYNKARAMEKTMSEWSSNLGASLKDGLKNFNSWVGDLETKMNEGMDRIVSNAFTSGQNIITGLMDGLASMWDGLVSFAGNIGESVSNKFDKVWEINSPSKLFRRKALYIGEGAIQGMEMSKPSMENKALELAKVADVDYSQTTRTNTGQVSSNSNGLDSGLINKLINSISSIQINGGNTVSQAQPIILKIGEAELARTTIKSIRQYEKQTGNIVLG